jgi:hypothetical protein
MNKREDEVTESTVRAEERKTGKKCNIRKRTRNNIRNI